MFIYLLYGLVLLVGTPVLYLGQEIYADAPVEASLPDWIKELLDEHVAELCTTQGVAQFDWLPEYFVKKSDPEYTRLYGAKVFAQAIKKYNLKLHIPQKYRYQTLNNLHYVVAAAARASGKLITLEELKDLVFLAMTIRWLDIMSRNFIKTEDGLTIIDTEPRFKYYLGNKLHKSQCKAVIYYLLSQKLDIFTPEAAEHIRSKASRLRRKLRRLHR